MAYVTRAISHVTRNPRDIVLLGITPDTPETQYGWIEPEQPFTSQSRHTISRVRKFWEKPSRELAAALMWRNCLWNSFVLVGRADTLLGVAQRCLPRVYESVSRITPYFWTPDETEAIREVLGSIPDSDFSKDVLATSSDNLMVTEVRDVGWCDLGDRSRLLSVLRSNSSVRGRVKRQDRIAAMVHYLQDYCETHGRNPHWPGGAIHELV